MLLLGKVTLKNWLCIRFFYTSAITAGIAFATIHGVDTTTGHILSDKIYFFC
jgi:hypothetical protein